MLTLNYANYGISMLQLGEKVCVREIISAARMFALLGTALTTNYKKLA